MQIKGNSILILVFVIFISAAASAYEGFGADTQGGEGGSVVHVTNLNDAGSGSLRSAVSSGNRMVVFDVGGEINLNTYLDISKPFITIDGLSVPSPVTLKNNGIRIRGERGAHDIIIRGIRIRSAADDGIQVNKGTYNVVIDHVSVHGSADGNIDITFGSHDVTVSWSILAEPADGEKNMLIKYNNPTRISLHHNIFVGAGQRNPVVVYDDISGNEDTDTTIDMRNNIVWDWNGPGSEGTKIRDGATANIINNFYGSNGGDKDDALIICTTSASNCANFKGPARTYVHGNYDADGININNRGTETNPFLSPIVDAQNPLIAAYQVLSTAGVRPLDNIDSQYLSSIKIPIPDLFIESADFSPSKPRAGRPVSFKAKVKDMGKGENFGTYTSLSIDEGNDGTWDIVSIQQTTFLSTKKIVNVRWKQIWTAVSGMHKYRICTDPDNVIPEYDESNNCVEGIFVVGVPKDEQYTLPDLFIEKFTYLPSRPRNGIPVTFNSKVKNQGDETASETRTRLRIDTKNDGTWDVVLYDSTKSLISGRRTTARWFRAWTAASGIHKYEICTDADNIILESNETNNCVEETFIVGTIFDYVFGIVTGLFHWWF